MLLCAVHSCFLPSLLSASESEMSGADTAWDVPSVEDSSICWTFIISLSPLIFQGEKIDTVRHVSRVGSND